MNEAFIIEDEAKVTYINKLTGEKWPTWKTYKDCSVEEKKQINLASYPKNCICFDRDLKDYDEGEINKDYHGFRAMLEKRYIKNFYMYRSPNGYHVIAPFKDLDKIDEKLKREFKRFYVSLFLSDTAKISDRGILSLPGRPHFKDGKIYNIAEWRKGENTMLTEVLEECKLNISKSQDKLVQVNVDRNFTNYFEEDPFFQYIQLNEIPDNTNRDMTIFPNLAVACAKSGHPIEYIKQILEPVILKNFPGKSWSEFQGWLNKAYKGDIDDYNPFQLNNWMKTYTANGEVYDLTPLDARRELKDPNKKSNSLQIYWDNELHLLGSVNTEWLIEKWIPAGDICFVAGKAASYKTTLCLHLSYAIAEGMLAFQKYKTVKSKVLYLNEENSSNILMDMITRVKKGLQIVSTENVAFSVMENLKLDLTKDCEKLIAFINENDIKVLICDSFRRFISFDENNATEMNILFNNLKNIRKRCGNLTIIILHHMKKDNAQNAGDVRDQLRGSSDIVNSADSIIGIGRKHGSCAIQMQHIKNRSGEEMTNKLIKIDSGDDKDSAYFWETDIELDETKIMSKPEAYCDDIMKYLEDNKIKVFKASDIEDNFTTYTHYGVSQALKILSQEGSIMKDGNGCKTRYLVNSVIKQEGVKVEPVKTVVEQCIEDLLEHLKTNDITSFQRTDLMEPLSMYTYDCIYKVLKKLVDDGTLLYNNRGNLSNYVVSTFNHKQSTL